MILDEEILQIAGFKVSVIRSPRRKNLSLEINQNGVLARAPNTMRQQTISRFVQKKQSWIQRTLSKQPKPVAPLNLKDGCHVKLLDQDLILDVIEGHRGEAKQDGNYLQLPITRSPKPQAVRIKNKLTPWYKDQALETVQQQVEHYASQMVIKAPRHDQIKVRDYKRRWGSCSQKGALSFNWRIIMAPQSVLDYVVIHELAHLKEFNHSKRFWRIVEQQMPNWRDHKNWLNQNGQQLYRF